MTTITAINQGEKRFCEYKNKMSGGFFTKLFETIFAADTTNQARLHAAFPEEVDAVRRYQNENGYWEALQIRYSNI